MREEIVKAIEDNKLTEFVIDQYGNMPTKTVRRLLILLAWYFTERSDDWSRVDFIGAIEKYYQEDFE